MKTIIINAGPRKNWNTDLMLREAQKGAESVGAETEYIDLYSLNFTGCRSCLACKLKGAEKNKCYWKDDLSPVIEKILSADCVIIGSPIYLGEPTAGFRALFERLCFCTLSYEGDPYFEGKVNVGLVFTMNAPRQYYETTLQNVLGGIENTFRRFLNGKVGTVAACATMQVDNYSRYSMGRFDPEERKQSREEQFPKDLAAAFELGAGLSKTE